MGFRFLIHPPGWPLAETHISHELVPVAESPVVSLTRFEEGKWRYFERGSLTEEQIEDALQIATKYLAAQETRWTVDETKGFLGFFKRPAHARAAGGIDLDMVGKGPRDRAEYGLTMRLDGLIVADDFAPERLLSPTVMLQASEHLKSKSIMVVIPRRGLLVAAPGAPTDMSSVMSCASSAKELYEGAEGGICPHVFFVEDGQLVGSNFAQPDGSFALTLAKVELADWYV